MEKWLDILPATRLSGYGVETGNNIIRTKMSAGAERQRRRFTQVPTMVKAKWTMTSKQTRIFEAWYRYKLFDGANWFKMNLKSANGVQENDVRFTKGYKLKLLSHNLWELTADIESRLLPVMSEADLDHFTGNGYTPTELSNSVKALSQVADSFDHYVNVLKHDELNWRIPNA